MTDGRAYHERSNLIRFRKSIKRLRKLANRRSGFFRYYFAVVKNAKKKNVPRTKDELPSYKVYRSTIRPMVTRHPPFPEFSDNIKFLAENKNVFSRQSAILPSNGVFEVPSPFSLTENYDESFLFLKKLFFALYQDKFEDITLDYSKCSKVDIDASVCMDILIQDFVTHLHKCWKGRHPRKLKTIIPVHFNKEVEKILFSIGAYKNLLNREIKYEDIIPFPLMIGDNRSRKLGQDKEIEVTKMVDYIVECLSEMNRTLTWQAEDDLSKVIGEVLINAAEHCGHRYRYSIGYFQKTDSSDTDKVGVFNLAILDFGKTIYENFKALESEKLEVVERMKELSKTFTEGGLFRKKQFEEETLWTLYALQEGVTSVKAKKRGNGSIHFIESFFQLKGDLVHDKSSFLTLMSGNTRIMFDGAYPIRKVMRGKDNTEYKMMTFNESGNIEELPDDKYVTFAQNFFPGTLIVARIFIKFNNIEKEEKS